MVGAAARGAKQSPRLLIGQSSVIDVTCDSFQREEKCFSDSTSPVRTRSASGATLGRGAGGEEIVVMQRLLYIKTSSKVDPVLFFLSPLFSPSSFFRRRTKAEEL